MSTIRVGRLASRTGMRPPAFTRQRAATGHCQYRQTVNIVEQSMNVSSVTDNSAGNAFHNAATSFSLASYCVVCDAGWPSVSAAGVSTVTAAETGAWKSWHHEGAPAAAQDANTLSTATFGTLA
jgi:hypothetical protein